MPHASTWFPGSPSADGNADGQLAGNEDDDDLEVASERISLKCPLTLLPMREPVSSRKCPHSFERAAFLELLSASQIRAPGGGSGRLASEKAMKCPVCEVVSPSSDFPRTHQHNHPTDPKLDTNQMLTASDLYTDPFLVRKIARIEAAAADSDSEDEAPLTRGPQRRLPQRINSDDEAEEGDESAARTRASTQVKGERLASSAVAMVGGRREVSMVPATQLEAMEGIVPTSTAQTDIVDLEDDEEDEEEGSDGEEDE